MVATQSFSISRRTLDVEDYIDIGRRHAGWIVGPAFFGIVASICVAFMLPNEYTSKATMQITPAQISESMVQTTISNSLNERIQQMETQILSRTELGGIINDPRLQLYKEEQKTRPLEDVIEDMKHAINISFVNLPGALGRRASAFDITFSYPDRFKAQQTVSVLMSKFDEENQTTQKSEQLQLNGLMSDLTQHAKADLQDASDKLTFFKESNAGKLPEQVSLNIAMEAGYTAKIQSDSDQIFRDNQSITQLETQKSAAAGQLEYEEEQNQILTTVAAAGSVQQNPELAALDKAIENIEFNLQGLHKLYSDAYPAIRNGQKQLDTYKAKREQVAKKVQEKAEADAAKAAADAANPKDAVPTAASLRAETRRHEVQEKIRQIEAEEQLWRDDIAKLKKEQDGYKKESDSINQMLKDTTGLEAQYDDLVRARNMAEGTYDDLLKKQQVADAQGQVIQRKAGEILDVLDNASLPITPTRPNRPMIIGAGFAMSLILGLGMAGLQEAKDTSLKNLKDVRAYTNLPVLCSIPLLENTMLVKRKRRLTYLAWSAAVIVGAAMVSGAVVYYETITNTAKG